MSNFSSALSALVGQHAHNLPIDQLLSAAQSLCSRDEVVASEPVIKVASTAEPAARFRNAGEFIVDLKTGLTWSKTLDAGKLNFKDAEAAVANLEIERVRGWRLPTIQELLTLVDYSRHDPAIDPMFECKSDWYWSSTPAALSPAGYAWIVDFSGGDAGWVGRGDRAFVRAVRPSQ